MGKNLRIPELVCPVCKIPLVSNDNMLFCEECRQGYPVCDGIPCFAPQNDFYEGKFALTHSLAEERFDKKLKFVPVHFRHVLMRLWLFSDFSQRRERFFRRFLPRFSNEVSIILDAGCGGGNKLFTKFALVVGIDLSLSSVDKANEIYNLVVQGDVCKLPFPCDSFDCIVSSDLIGHIRPERKDLMFREFHRVLKPGGIMLHVVETDANSLWFRITPKKKLEEQKWGHIGLEMPSALLARLKKIGFEELYVKKIWGTLLPLGSFVSLFDDGTSGLAGAVRLMVKLDKAAIYLPNKLRIIINCLLGLIYDIVEPLESLDGAEGLLIACKKSFMHRIEG